MRSLFNKILWRMGKNEAELVRVAAEAIRAVLLRVVVIPFR